MHYLEMAFVAYVVSYIFSVISRRQHEKSFTAHHCCRAKAGGQAEGAVEEAHVEPSQFWGFMAEWSQHICWLMQIALVIIALCYLRYGQTLNP